MRALLVRHAESIGAGMHRLQGWGERPLSECGRRTARNAAAQLDGWSDAYVISSPLRRAVETAQLLAGRVDLLEAAWAEQAVDADLLRVDLHEAVASSSALDDEGWPAGGHDPRLEPVGSIAVRVAASLAHHAQARTAEKLLVVTHGACLVAAQRIIPGAAGGPRHPGNLHALQLQLKDGVWVAEHWRNLRGAR